MPNLSVEQKLNASLDDIIETTSHERTNNVELPAANVYGPERRRAARRGGGFRAAPFLSQPLLPKSVQNRAARPKPPRRRLSPEESAVLECQVSGNEDGDTIIRYKDTDVVRINASNGEITLTSGGWKTVSTKAVMNQSLKPISIRIEEENEEWVVREGKTNSRKFEEGIVLKVPVGISKQLVTARGSIVKQHLQQRKKDLEGKLSSVEAAPGNEKLLQMNMGNQTFFLVPSPMTGIQPIQQPTSYIYRQPHDRTSAPPPPPPSGRRPPFRGDNQRS